MSGPVLIWVIVTIAVLAAVIPTAVNVGRRALALGRAATAFQREVQPVVEAITAGADKASAHAEALSRHPVLTGEIRPRGGRRSGRRQDR